MKQMFILATVLCVVAAVDDPQGAVDKPQCCGPRKYSAVALEMSSIYRRGASSAQLFSTRVDMNFDYDRKMTVNVYRDLGNMKIILDYRVSTMYIIPPDGSCHQAYLPPEYLLDPCDPGNFTYNGRYTVGSAANSMSIVEYVGPVGNFFLSLTATDDCTPVTVAMRGQSHDETQDEVHALLLTNVQRDVVDEDSFNVPVVCYMRNVRTLRKRDIEQRFNLHLPF